MCWRLGMYLYTKIQNIWVVFKTSIKLEWKLFILARNPCAILAGRWFPELWCILFACVVQVRSWFRTWDSWLLRFSTSRLVRWFSLSHFLACLVASRLLGSTQRSSYFSSSLVPECLQWAYGLEPKNKQYSGTSIVANMIILPPVSVEHSGQEPLCLREAYANLARNSGQGASKVKLTRNS